MAMTLFTTFATYSAMMILVAPLGLYGYLSGINLMVSTQWPCVVSDLLQRIGYV
jgi:hypothetical protein